MPTSLLPQRLAGRTSRVSRFLFQWEAFDGLDPNGKLTARTGQVGTFARAAVKSTALDKYGVAYSVGYHIPAYDNVAGAPVGIRMEEGVFSFPFNALPQAMTVYDKFVEMGDAADAANRRVFTIGTTSTTAFWAQGSAAGYRLTHNNGAASAANALAAVPAVGDTVELRCVLNANGSILIGQSINAGAETTAQDATPEALAAAWSQAQLTLLWDAASTVNHGDAKLQSLRIAAGVQTMARMRAA